MDKKLRKWNIHFKDKRRLDRTMIVETAEEVSDYIKKKYTKKEFEIELIEEI